MKTIMLAVCGPRPHEEAVGYSLRLAQRMKARLEVLQIVPDRPAECECVRS